MNKHILFSFALLMLFLLATPTHVIGVNWDDDTTRPSLQGLQGLSVEVAIGMKEIQTFEKCSVNIDQLKTDIELRLRLAGINVLSRKELIEKIAGAPCLFISFGGKIFEPSESFNVDLYVVSINVDLVQMVH